MKHVSTIAYIRHLRRAQVAPPAKRTWLKRLVALLAFASAAGADNHAPTPTCAMNDMACIHKLLGYARPDVVVIYRAAKGKI